MSATPTRNYNYNAPPRKAPHPVHVARYVKEHEHLGRKNLVKLRERWEMSALKEGDSIGGLTAREMLLAIDTLLKRKPAEPTGFDIADLVRRIEALELVVATEGRP